MTVYYRHDWAGTIQVRGCVEIEQDGEKFIEEAPNEEAQFFGVYVGQEDGPMMWHSDHLTEEQANAVAQRLLCRVNRYDDIGLNGVVLITYRN